MIIGTVGHIDHGKTALVRALTGVDTDRLAEEKARGITIDLGFAYTDLGDGSISGFVDMPGHERLIHTMIAGAGGIDLGLLVVAADDGIMPQTREHLTILRLLGLTRVVVAVSKADLAGPGRLDALRAMIATELAPTPFAGAPVLAVSAQGGQGIGALRRCLADEAARVPPPAPGGAFRLSIDRAFTLAGAGTVVTGTVLSGRVRVGDQVLISPAGLPARVRGLRCQNQPADAAGPRDRVALNLAGPARDQISRGDMALDPRLHGPVARVDLRLDWLGAKAFASGVRARLHSGAGHAGVRLVDLGAAPGGGRYAQAVLDRALPLGWGARLILRDPSGEATLGGGTVLDIAPPARRRATPERLAALAAHARPDPADALAALLTVAPYHVDLDEFLRARAIPDGAAIAGNAVILGTLPRLALTPARHGDLLGQISAILEGFHADNPDLQGMGREALRLSLQPRLPKPAFAALLQAQAGTLALEGGFVRLASHTPRMSPLDEALFAEIAPLLGAEARFRPPRVRDLAGALGRDEREIRQMLKLAARLGRVDQIAQDHFFLRATTAEMAALARALSAAGDGGWFGAPAFRDHMDNGRKVAIQILDFFDRQGLTLRRGDLRRINPHRADLF
ncbi:MAG: selenocysteine-specific translation elongation factor [Paracoccus sp. (in: a-proteobacteria)]|nr:selenocysteine-specific translation elongation factor [Paracoccus sp. (in: a-proteobacteria)]